MGIATRDSLRDWLRAPGSLSRRLAREEGLLVGISSGANVHVAVEVAAGMAPGQKVVTILCDSGLRYLSARVFE